MNHYLWHETLSFVVGFLEYNPVNLVLGLKESLWVLLVLFGAEILLVSNL